MISVLSTYQEEHFIIMAIGLLEVVDFIVRVGNDRYRFGTIATGAAADW